MPFEYWDLPKSDNVTTRIVRCYKDGKYIVFTRDDGKECKYDLATGEVIGFRGKPVKRLSSQLKDLTCKRLFEITENPIYRQFFEWVWKWHPNGKAWVFFEYTMPDFKNYEQYFTSGFTNIESRLKYGFNEIPKGLFKLCRTYNIKLTNKLAKTYIENPNVFNVLLGIDFGKCSIDKMIEAVCHGCVINKQYTTERIEINPDNLLERKTINTTHKQNGRDSYFISLINDYGYNAKLLFEYVDSVKIGRKFKKEIFQDIFDYADMMTQLYDSFDRYPEDFSHAHRRSCEEYNRITISYDEVQYSQRNVLDYECEIDGFKFIYPRTTQEIKEEARQQHNCVATYINRVLEEDCHIMFMRPIDDLDHSYITLEIRSKRIVQAKRKFNNEPSEGELEIIKKWNKRYNKFELQ